MAKKLNEIQLALVRKAISESGVDYYVAAQLGANGSTLNALVKSGHLVKSDEGGKNVWTVTESGITAST